MNMRYTLAGLLIAATLSSHVIVAIAIGAGIALAGAFIADAHKRPQGK